MFRIYKLNIIYLILYLRFSELNSKSIIGHQQDNGGIYDNVNNDDDNFTNIYYENDIYGTSRLYKPLLSTDISLEQSIMPAQIIHATTPSMTTDDSYNYNNSISTNPFITEDEDDALTTEPEDLVINTDELESLLVKFESNDGNLCLLSGLRKALLWWSFSNGTLKVNKLNEVEPTIAYLDLSYQNLSDDEDLYEKMQNVNNNNNTQLEVFSLAYNNFTKVPIRTLDYLAQSLKFLSLAGNQFAAPVDVNTRSNNESNTFRNTPSHCNSRDENPPNGEETKKMLFNKEQQGTEWATFPYLPRLLELDLSNCHIDFITKRVFQNLTHLERLYMAHNKILTIPYDSFRFVPSLELLDLSFLNILEPEEKVTVPNLDAIINIFFGINIQQTAFKFLTKLLYLDLSHTRMTKSSAVAFTHLGKRLQYLSVCYTSFAMLDKAIFRNTGLVGLDVSGNLIAGHNIPDDAFEGLADSLKYLYFESANVKDLAWLPNLKNLRFLGLADNNINSFSQQQFQALKNLQLLDLSSNQVGNWYNRVFSFNENLRVLSLRNNNLNIITSEMMKDLSLLEYLSLGDNNFVCDCLLRQLVNVAKENNKNEKCRSNVLKDLQDAIIDKGHSILDGHVVNRTHWGNHVKHLNISDIIWRQHLKKLQTGYWNLRKSNDSRLRFNMRLEGDNQKSCLISSTAASEILDQQNGTILKFQLLDYQDENYYCFNETERMKFVELNCQQKSFVQDIADQLNTLTTYIVVCLASIVGISLIGFLVYWKRWYIHYYYCYFKTASLMSAAAKENNNRFHTTAQHDPSMVYDVFISYCQNDRDWILEHLMPNVEETGDISICLHERDFQIGVTILDNIVSCMDRSRALMLIISSDFLLSHWCQFEMHLAQHRIFDVSQDHLILIFLEDIPRSKRPKHLQYLMDVKTYIKWPGGKDTKSIRLEERKLFWKRLKRSLVNIGVNPVESKA